MTARAARAVVSARMGASGARRRAGRATSRARRPAQSERPAESPFRPRRNHVRRGAKRPGSLRKSGTERGDPLARNQTRSDVRARAHSASAWVVSTAGRPVARRAQRPRTSGAGPDRRASASSERVAARNGRSRAKRGATVGAPRCERRPEGAVSKRRAREQRERAVSVSLLTDRWQRRARRAGLMPAYTATVGWD